MTVAEFNKSVDDYSDGLYRFILKNIKDEEKAKDIIQDTYEKLWTKISNVSYQKVKSYLFTAAYHTMIDTIRKEKRLEDFEKVNADMYSHTRQYTGLSEMRRRLTNCPTTSDR